MIYELHLDGTPDERRIAQLLAALFDVEPHDVRLLRGSDGLSSAAHSSVIGIVRPRAGEFALSLEIIATGSDGLTREEVAAHFARNLACACLITDDPADPALWTLVTSEGVLLPADVDPEALDRDELRVVRVRHAGRPAF